MVLDHEDRSLVTKDDGVTHGLKRDKVHLLEKGGVVRCGLTSIKEENFLRKRSGIDTRDVRIVP